jgi:hypothetical protein
VQPAGAIVAELAGGAEALLARSAIAQVAR